MSTDPPPGWACDIRMREGFRAPDVAEAIVAWRAWSLRRARSGRVQLAPVFTRAGVWPAREPMRAVCAAGGEPGWRSHPSPGEACRCGVYAVKSIGQLPRDAHVMTATTAVVGSVALWGRVVEHDRGYRAEFAYPSLIRLICPGCFYLLMGGAPDRVVPLEDGSLAPVCQEHLGVVEAAGAPRAAESLQAELLETYAVGLLPAGTIAAR